MNEVTDPHLPLSTAGLTGHFTTFCAFVGLMVPLSAIAADGGQPNRGPVAEVARTEATEHANEAIPQDLSPFSAAVAWRNAVVSPDASYGPVVPKSRNGAVPVVDWTEPGPMIPPALDQAVTLVTKNYPSALSARTSLQAAASDVKSAQWLRLPSFSGNMVYLNDDRGVIPQVVVEAPVWTGGRITSNIRRAQAQEDVSSARYVETVQDLALTTAQVYFEIARLTERERLLESGLKEHLALVETMQRRVAQEVSPQADLELVQSRAAQIEQDYTTAAAQRRATLRMLAELIGDPTYDFGPLPNYDPELTLSNRDALEQQAIVYSPELKRLNGEVDVARAERDGRKAQLLPQVGAQYSYDDVFGHRVGVVVRAQNNGVLSELADVNSASLRMEAVLESIRASERQLRSDVGSTLIQYDAAKRRASIAQKASITAARVSDSYTRQFIAGRRSWLDVMNALREAVNAEISRTDAEVAVMAAATELLLLSGRWRPIFGSDANF